VTDKAADLPYLTGIGPNSDFHEKANPVKP
jgi:hypothetical protein